MGNTWITGKDAEKLLSLTTTEDASKVSVGKSQYTTILCENGTVIDDTIFMHVDKRFMLIPNAGQSKIVVDWLNKQAKKHNLDAKAEDVSQKYVILAVQGPKSRETLQKLTNEDLSKIGFFGCKKINFAGTDVIISFTGYTGELGYEFQIKDFDSAKKIFEKILEAGKDFGIKPIGLGARDTLRLEKFFLLAGNEFEGGRTPLEANISFFINWDHDFIGKKALQEQKETGEYERLTALICTEKGIPRHGCAVEKDGQKIGVVSSGTLSPCLNKGIAMAYIKPDYIKIDNEVDILIRGKKVRAKMIKPPFVPKDWAEKQ
jgi:aminomethyltransferase